LRLIIRSGHHIEPQR